MSCILWNIFANDLCLHVPDSVRIIQFADDTQLWTTGRKRDLPLLVDRMESALKNIFDWFCENDMKVNAAKTEFMTLGTKAMLRDLPDVTIRFATIRFKRVGMRVVSVSYSMKICLFNHMSTKLCGSVPEC